MIVDGWIIPEDLSLTFARAGQNDVDVLVGSNKDEGTFVMRGPTADQWTTRVRARWADLRETEPSRHAHGRDSIRVQQPEARACFSRWELT
jgi:para-nitrobenzyl esterase